MSSQVMWQFKKDTLIAWTYQEGDEFNGNRVDTTYWNYFGWTRSIFGNKEQQYYTSGKNHLVKDGRLFLFAERKKINARTIDWMDDHDSLFSAGKFAGFNKRDFEWTAAHMETGEHFVYGYYEIKFCMPSKKGFWPAFWLAGGMPNEEIDMMELKTDKKNQIHVGRHSTKREENYLRSGLRKKAWGDWLKIKGDLSQGYHIVAADWTPEDITWYLNGEIIAYTKLGLSHPKRMIVNIAVPSNNGPFKPGPADSITHSGHYEIDYVRVWRKTSENIPAKKSFLVRDTTTGPIQKTRLVTKKKFIYGKKKQHANEGITVSVAEAQKNFFTLTVIGKEIPADGKYTVKTKEGIVIASGPLVYGETILDLKDTPKQRVLIEVEAYGRVASYAPRKNN